MKITFERGLTAANITPLIRAQLQAIKNIRAENPAFKIEWHSEAGDFPHPWLIYPTALHISREDDDGFAMDREEPKAYVHGYLSHNPGRDRFVFSTHINLADHALQGVPRSEDEL